MLDGPGERSPLVYGVASQFANFFPGYSGLEAGKFQIVFQVNVVAGCFGGIGVSHLVWTDSQFADFLVVLLVESLKGLGQGEYSVVVDGFVGVEAPSAQEENDRDNACKSEEHSASWCMGVVCWEGHEPVRFADGSREIWQSDVHQLRYGKENEISQPLRFSQ